MNRWKRGIHWTLVHRVCVCVKNGVSPVVLPVVTLARRPSPSGMAKRCPGDAPTTSGVKNEDD
jgi:hypothetical protein